MFKNFKFMIAALILVVTISSCKKSTSDLSILTGHKWKMSTSVESYSDSAVTHNLIYVNPSCQTTGYTEFHDYANESSIRLAYNYTTSQCPGYNLPNIGMTSWNIDNDNANLYMNGDPSTGLGGQWFTLTSISGSQFVVTYVYQRVIGNSGAPNFTNIYDTATDVTTFTSM
jgi:hypothetical protein